MLALKGKEVADNLSSQLIQQVQILKNHQIQPTLAIIRVGEEDDQLSYERAAIKKAESLNINYQVITLQSQITTQALINTIEQLNNDPQIHGILLLQPLPKHIDNELVKNAISLNKDVDCCNEASLGQFFVHYGHKPVIAPCTAEAVIALLDYYKIQIAGKNIVVLGRSLVIGRPIATMLCAKNATVTICHSQTSEEALIKSCQQADIIISAIGVYDRLPATAIKDNHILIDVGINFVDGKLKGDFNAETIKAQALTPVPGGIGTITTTILMKHLIELCQRQ